MTQVSVLYVDETVRFDQTQIRHLFKLLGTADAQDVLHCAMQELARHISRAEQAFQAQQWDRLGPIMSALGKIGDEIGMQSLCQASRAVAICNDAQDSAARAATFFRLLRVGDRSLSDYRLLCDSSG